MYTYQLNSYTVFNTTVYSDGETVCNPPVMLDKNILICTKCTKPFWTEDAFLPEENNDLSIEEFPQAKDVHDLPFAFDSDFSLKLTQYYSELLEKAFANTVEREVYLRIELWRLLNNGIRNITDNSLKDKIIGIVKEVLSKDDNLDPADRSDLFNNNLKKLISLYNPNTDDELLLLAEMHRECGNFSEASRVLDQVKDIDNSFAYKEISKAIKIRNTKVFRLNKH